jgi:hypothetical protein
MGIVSKRTTENLRISHMQTVINTFNSGPMVSAARIEIRPIVVSAFREDLQFEVTEALRPSSCFLPLFPL